MGGNYDVDMELTAPNGQLLYKDVKKQYDSFTWKADVKGVYSFCFSNEFSTFTHKVVYFDLQVGEEKPVVEAMGGEHASAMTLVGDPLSSCCWCSSSSSSCFTLKLNRLSIIRVIILLFAVATSYPGDLSVSRPLDFRLVIQVL